MEKTEFEEFMNNYKKSDDVKANLKGIEEAFLKIYEPMMKENNESLKGLTTDDIKALSSIFNNPKYILKTHKINKSDIELIDNATNDILKSYEDVKLAESDKGKSNQDFHLGYIYGKIQLISNTLKNFK